MLLKFFVALKYIILKVIHEILILLVYFHKCHFLNLKKINFDVNSYILLSYGDVHIDVAVCKEHTGISLTSNLPYLLFPTSYFVMVFLCSMSWCERLLFVL